MGGFSFDEIGCMPFVWGFRLSQRSTGKATTKVTMAISVQEEIRGPRNADPESADWPDKGEERNALKPQQVGKKAETI
jgi:hypothetical protein